MTRDPPLKALVLALVQALRPARSEGALCLAVGQLVWMWQVCPCASPQTVVFGWPGSGRWMKGPWGVKGRFSAQRQKEVGGREL